MASTLKAGAASPNRAAEWRRAGGIALRLLAAIGGGYGLASLAAMTLALLLPLDRMDAVLTGMMTGLLLHAAAVLWVFAAPSALRAWIGLIAIALPLAALALLGHWQASGQPLP